MNVILIGVFATTVACGYADAKESDEAFRSGKALEANSILAFFFGPKPSIEQMMGFNLAYQVALFLIGLLVRSEAAVYFACTALAFRAAQHLTQAYWGMRLNTGRPTPRVDKWWQKFFWQHSNVEE